MEKLDINIVEIASKTASGHIGRAIFNMYSTPADAEEVSVYSAVFKELLIAAAISEDEMKQRIRLWAKQSAVAQGLINGPDEGSRKGFLMANAMAGNMIKEAERANMNQKVFKKLIKAVFPLETWWRADLTQGL